MKHRTVSIMEGLPQSLPKAKTKLPQLISAFAVNMINFEYGLAAGWPTPSLPLLQSNATALNGIPITEEETSWLGSLLFLGALVTCPAFSFMVQHFGRKKVGYVVSAVLIPGWLLIVFGDTVPYIYAARILMGIASAGINIFCPMYVAEIAEDSLRGTLGTLRAVFGNLGSLVIFAAAPFLSVQQMAAVSLIPLLYLLAFIFLPESPLYLMKIGKEKEAMESMIWLRGGNKDLAEQEISKLSIVVKELSCEGSLIAMLQSRGTRRALIICIVLYAAQQFSGAYPVSNYMVSILEQAGSTVSPITSSIIVGVVTVIGALVSSVLVDIAGRRILLLSSLLSMAFVLAVLGSYFYLQAMDFDMSVVGMIPVICVSLYIFFLSTGTGSVTYVLLSEMFNAQARGMAASVCISVMWLSAFIATKFYPKLVLLLDMHGSYWFFSAVCIACAVFSYLKIPETKNRSLESILRELNNEKCETNVKLDTQQHDRIPYIISIKE